MVHVSGRPDVRSYSAAVPAGMEYRIASICFKTVTAGRPTGRSVALARVGANFRMLYACRRRQVRALADELQGLIGDRLQLLPVRTVLALTSKWRFGQIASTTAMSF